MNEESIKFQNLLKKILRNNQSQQFKDLKKLIWSIIYIKEDKSDETISDLRWIIERSHKSIVKRLVDLVPGCENGSRFNILKDSYIKKNSDQNKWRKFLQNPTWSSFNSDFKSDHKDHVYFLLNNKMIFPELKIKDEELISITRNYFSIISKKHDGILCDNEKIGKLSNISIFCGTFRQFLLSEWLRKLRSDKLNFRTEHLNNFSLKSVFPYIMSLSEEHLIEYTIKILFEDSQMRNELFKNQIFTQSDIRNRSILQDYYPLIYLNDYHIEHVLNSKDVVEFRPEGPHLIDYDVGEWLYLPDIASNIYDELNSNKTVLLSGKSGSGKSVIARYIGYKYNLTKENSVFYFDLLNIEIGDLRNILDYLLRQENSINDNDNILLIFENIHILKENERKRLNSIGNLFTCLFVERNVNKPEEIYEYPKNDDENKTKSKEDFEIISLDQSFSEIKSGIIEKYIKKPIIREQFENLPIEDLWMLSFILRIYLKKNVQGEKVHLPEILSDSDLLSLEIHDYFRILFENCRANFSYKVSQMGKLLNNSRLVLMIISIFSEHEYWVSESFIKDALNECIPINIKNIFNYSEGCVDEIIEFLVLSKQILHRERVNQINSFDDEYRIPHKKLAMIYKNIFYNPITKLGIIIPNIYAFYMMKEELSNSLSLIWRFNFRENRIHKEINEKISDNLLQKKVIDAVSEKILNLNNNSYLKKSLYSLKNIYPDFWNELIKEMKRKIEDKPELIKSLILDFDNLNLIDFFKIFEISSNYLGILPEDSEIYDIVEQKVKQANTQELFYYLVFFHKLNKKKHNFLSNKLINSTIDQMKLRNIKEIRNFIFLENEEFRFLNFDIMKEILNENIEFNEFIKDYIVPNFICFNFDEYSNILLDISPIQTSLARPLVKFFQEESCRDEFWEIFKKKILKVDIIQIKFALIEVFKIFKQDFKDGINKSFFINFFRKLDSEIIHKIENDHLNRGASQIDLIIEIFECIDSIGIIDDLLKTKFLISFDWIFSILQKHNIYELSDKGILIYDWELKHLVSKEKSDFFLRRFKDLFNQKFEDLINTAESFEDYEKIYLNMNNFRRKLTKQTRNDFLVLILNKFAESHLFNPSYIKLVKFYDFAKYFQNNRKFQEIILKTSSDIILDNLNNILCELPFHYDSFINFFEEPLKLVLKEDYDFIQKKITGNSMEEFKKFRILYQKRSFGEINQRYSEENLYFFKTMSKFINKVKLEHNEFTDIFEMIINLNWKKIIENLLKFNIIVNDFLDNLNHEQINQLINILSDERNFNEIIQYFYLGQADRISCRNLNDNKDIVDYQIDWNIQYLYDFIHLDHNFIHNIVPLWLKCFNLIDLAILGNISDSSESETHNIIIDFFKNSNLSQLSYVLLERSRLVVHSPSSIIGYGINVGSITIMDRFNNLLDNLDFNIFDELIQIDREILEMKGIFIEFNLSLNNISREFFDNLVHNIIIFDDKIKNTSLFGLLLLTSYFYGRKEDLNESNLSRLFQTYKKRISKEFILSLIEKCPNSNKIFKMVNILFGFLMKIDSCLAKSLWDNTVSYFSSESFLMNIQERNFSKIVEFYFRFQDIDSLKHMNNVLDEFLKRKYSSMTFREFKDFILADEINDGCFDLIRIYFAEQIKENFKHYIKQTITNTMRLNNFGRKKQKKDLSKKEIYLQGLINKKLNEKYVIGEDIID